MDSLKTTSINPTERCGSYYVQTQTNASITQVRRILKKITQEIEEKAKELTKKETKIKAIENMEVYQNYLHKIFAVAFMYYLDKHRKNEKMYLSNEECEDITNAFLGKDWVKLYSYCKKYMCEKEPKGKKYHL